MTDHAHDAARDELIRAYVDGELAADAALAVEGDPALLAEVTAQREVRALLSRPDPPSATARNGAVAAALAEFADRSTPVATVGARHRTRWLMPAAAAVLTVVIAAGAIALSRDDETHDASEQRRDADDAAAVVAPAATSSAESGTFAIAAEASEDTARAESATAGGATPAAAPIPVLASADELAAFGAGLQTATMEAAADAATATTAPAAPVDAGEEATTTVSTCGPDGSAVADLVVDGDLHRVVVHVDEARREVVALDAVTCAEVQRTPLP